MVLMLAPNKGRRKGLQARLPSTLK
jgi:hypothetical protein